jgi:hypothetical protein
MLGTFTNLSHSALLGAGAFLTLSGIAVKSYFSGRKVRATSPYSYLLDVQREFALPPWIEN